MPIPDLVVSADGVPEKHVVAEANPGVAFHELQVPLCRSCGWASPFWTGQWATLPPAATGIDRPPVGGHG
eukprot:7856479-Pyramimonas_sp.AAC.1